MKCVYIYNPKSGKQKNSKICELVKSTLETKFDVVDVQPTTKRGDAGEFARLACGVYDCLVVSGGDGTMNEVINAIANQPVRPKIGYIPTGTVNDLAHSLKIPKNPKKALKIILDGNTTDHDIFRINNRYGIYVCGFGAFTSVSYMAQKKTKKKIGKLAYYMSGLRELRRIKKFPISIHNNNLEIESEIVLGLIVNNRYVGGYKINKNDSHDDGFVNVVLFKERRKKGLSFKTIFNIAKLFLGGIMTLKTSKNCIVLKEQNNFTLSLPDNMIINIDGERATHGSFVFEVLPRHVEIFVKEDKEKQKQSN